MATDEPIPSFKENWRTTKKRGSPLSNDKKTPEHFQSMYHKKTEILTGKHIVWNNFIQGLGENLESRKNEIDPYLNTFAKTMKISPLLVKSYLNHQDYNGLVSSIINAHSLQ
jgi:hypothetical protein